MTDLVPKSFKITRAQEAFLKRKRKELRKAAPPGREKDITESKIVQGLLSFWMESEAGNSV
jgi:hypothetical protein